MNHVTYIQNYVTYYEFKIFTFVQMKTNKMKINKMKKVNCLFICFLMMGLSLVSCLKDNGTKSTLSIRMTDAPGPYNAVNIDLLGVEVTGTNNDAVLLDINPGIYNLLNFANGEDTLIGTGTLDVGSVEQIRLILGPNNTVLVNNISYSLSTPSAEQSGLKLQVHQTLEAGVEYSILLDFDANQSIVNLGNGAYKLKPVIRTIDNAISGSIKGKISPISLLVTVTATSTLASYSSVVNTSGDFLIKGLPAGVYSVTVTPQLPVNPVTKTNITVTTGVSTDLGTISLQ